MYVVYTLLRFSRTRQCCWKSTRIYLRLIKSLIFPWQSSSYRPSRTKEITLYNLRVTHSPLHHSYLLHNFPLPECPFSHAEKVLISHLLFDCHTLIFFNLEKTIFPLPSMTCFVTLFLAQ